MNKILTPKEKNNLVGAAKSPAYKKGGALSSIYATRMNDCGCKNKS